MALVELQKAKKKLLDLLKQHEGAIQDLRALLADLTDLQRQEVEKMDLSRLAPEERPAFDRLCEKMGLTRERDTTNSSQPSDEGETGAHPARGIMDHFKAEAAKKP